MRIKNKPAVKEVWNIILPVVPDTITMIDEGVYEARWWKPVPMMDIEILYRTHNIQLCSEPFEPDSLPSGIAVQFSVIDE